MPTVATNDVLYHAPERRILQDVVTCIRAGCTIDDAGFRRERFADRFLKGPEEMARLFARYPDAVPAPPRSPGDAGSRWPNFPTSTPTSSTSPA